MAGWLGESPERRPAADKTPPMAGHLDSCGIEVIERKGNLTDESVKWAGENVLPSRPQAVLLVEIITLSLLIEAL
jgi:hypothetical protein